MTDAPMTDVQPDDLAGDGRADALDRWLERERILADARQDRRLHALGITDPEVLADPATFLEALERADPSGRVALALARRTLVARDQAAAALVDDPVALARLHAHGPAIVRRWGAQVQRAQRQRRSRARIAADAQAAYAAPESWIGTAGRTAIGLAMARSRRLPWSARLQEARPTPTTAADRTAADRAELAQAVRIWLEDAASRLEPRSRDRRQATVSAAVLGLATDPERAAAASVSRSRGPSAGSGRAAAAPAEGALAKQRRLDADAALDHAVAVMATLRHAAPIGPAMAADAERLALLHRTLRADRPAMRRPPDGRAAARPGADPPRPARRALDRER
jgi:hypothetical protein